MKVFGDINAIWNSSQRDTYLRDQLDRASFDGGDRVEAVNGAVVKYVEGEEEG